MICRKILTGSRIDYGARGTWQLDTEL